MTVNIVGYHGTSSKNAEEIISNQFEISKGIKEWLGDGVYFFVKGLSTKPEIQAEDWGAVQSWDKGSKTYKYKRVSVVKSDIEVDDDAYLDLTTSEGVEVLNYIIDKHYEKISKIAKRFDYIDGLVINFAREEKILPIEVAKGNFYIRFKKERVYGIKRRISNSTIISVSLSNILNKKLTLTNEIG